MKVVREFSRFAHEYNRYNVIQKKVATKLCKLIDEKNYATILDVGAGDGAIYSKLLEEGINVSSFVALDFSKEMLNLHPATSVVKKICLDFNQKNFSSSLNAQKFDLIISSSALQWSKNLSCVLKELSALSDNFLFSFFTANTFKSLHQTIDIDSPILKKEKILEVLNEYFDYEMEIIEYRLNFESVHEMLRYIKRSGVSGGVKQLSYKQIKNLMLLYPLDYLEFEVIFVKVIKKK